MQVSFSAHAVSHVPQWSWSVVRSLHSPPQLFIGAMQSQRPIAQLVPDGQTLPQLPQFCESSATRTQAPEHATVPGSHGM